MVLDDVEFCMSVKEKEIASHNQSELLSSAPQAGQQTHPQLNHIKAVADDGITTTTTSFPSGLTTNSSGPALMDRRLLEAAITGDAVSMKDLVSNDRAVLLGRTPQGNTCLHIASIHGHEEFCKDALALNLSLLSAVNTNEDTPLLTSVKRGHVHLASFLLRHCRDRHLNEAILKQDNGGCNALHHALRGGHRELALELIAAEPALSQAVDSSMESPIFIAVMRDFTDVFEKLLQTPFSAHSGPFGSNALHAAVRKGNSALAKRLMETRPWLVREETKSYQYTPMHLAALEDKIDLLTVFLEHDPSLGYLISTAGVPILCTAALKGRVGVARELLRHCPDAPYCDSDKNFTCLHTALVSDQAQFVEFVLGSQQLRHLVNMLNGNGDTALDLAIKTQKQDMVAALRFHPGISVEDGTAPTRATSSSGASAIIDSRLLKAASTGDVRTLQQLARHDPAMLLGVTPQGNTCLHISCIHGHMEFSMDALGRSPSLLSAINADGGTPLHIAVSSGQISLASVLLSHHLMRREVILKQNNRGCNALHLAIRNGHKKLALDLIDAEPALSQAVNKYYESPMFMAAMRNDTNVLEKLLEIPDSLLCGPHGYNALHAAIRSNNLAMAQKIMETRPALATQNDKDGRTPVHHAVIADKIAMLRILLEHDRSLGYIISGGGSPLLVFAAHQGHVGVARELLKHCPDAPFSTAEEDWTCLHAAVWKDH